jgi:hypothetical protein
MFGKQDGGIIPQDVHNEEYYIKRNIRIIAETLGLEFESFCLGDYLLVSQQYKNKIEKLTDRLIKLEVLTGFNPDDYKWETETKTKLVKKGK